MKKFLIVLVAIFTINMGCKKIVDNGGICACSPVSYPYLSLVIKNNANQDLLDDKITGAFKKETVQVYSKDASGTIKQIAFFIRPPFSYGSDTFTFNQLYIPEVTPSTTNLFIKLGDNAPKEVKIEFNAGKSKVDKVLIDNKEAATETGKVIAYAGGNIFYLSL